MIKTGYACKEFVDEAVRHVLVKQGMLGVKVKIMTKKRVLLWQLLKRRSVIQVITMKHLRSGYQKMKMLNHSWEAKNNG